MPRAYRPCPTCQEPVLGRCEDCRRKSDQRRGTARQRGYDQQHEVTFRRAVLRRDPVCTCTGQDVHDHGEGCTRPSQHADHHPVDRRELVARGLNPNDPTRGRGLCARCHSSETALHQPGGWARRP
jgi:5-methylcytosine-specific restriction enzyme A